MACTSADLAIKQWGQLIGGKYETLSQGIIISLIIYKGDIKTVD